MKSLKNTKTMHNILVYGLYIILLTLVISSFFYLQFYTSSLTKKLDEIVPCIQSEDWEKSENMFSDFETRHRDKFKNLSFIIKHTAVEEVLLSMVDVSANIKLKNKDLSLIKLENLKFQIEHVYESQIPKFQNIL